MPTARPLIVDEEQVPPAGTPASQSSLDIQRKQLELNEFTAISDPSFAYEAFISTVERLEGLLDQETAILREHKLIALDEFNQKKRLGLLELRRAIAAICGLQLENLGLDPKPALARFRKKLQKNLSVLQTHLDAVATIAAIIARTIEQQDSDGTYTPEHALKAKRP